MVALAVALVQVVGTLGAARGQPEREPLDAFAIALLLLGPAALLARFRYPVAVVATVLAVAFLYMAIGYPYGPMILSVIVAIYTAVTTGHRLVAWLGAAVLYAVHMTYRALFGDSPGVSELLGVGAWMLLIVVGAEFAHAYRQRAAQRARVLREESRRRASEERLRIARELHDVLAHHISLIGVQAGVGLHLMDRQPEQARSALTAVEAASREAMTELRAVLDILQRSDDAPPPRAPAPSLRRLDSLRARAAAAGLQLAVEVEGAPVELSGPVEVAAYRVVQEAVTNVIRHSGGTAATIRLAYLDGEVAIAVEDDGARVRGAVQPGSGITGMRERVEALGGRFEAGPLPTRGFRVRAWLPTGTAE